MLVRQILVKSCFSRVKMVESFCKDKQTKGINFGITKMQIRNLTVGEKPNLYRLAEIEHCLDELSEIER